MGKPNRWNAFVKKYSHIPTAKLSKIYTHKTVQEYLKKHNSFPPTDVVESLVGGGGEEIEEDEESNNNNNILQESIVDQLQIKVDHYLELVRELKTRVDRMERTPSRLTVGITPGNHVTMPVNDAVARTISQLQIKWCEFTASLFTKLLPKIDEPDYLVNNLSKVIGVTIGEIDKFFLNFKYRDLCVGNAIKRFEIVDDSQLPDTTMQTRAAEIRYKSGEGVVEYLLPLATITPPNNNNGPRERSIYLTFDTDSVMMELSTSFMGSLQSPPTGVATVLDYDYDPADSDEERFAKSVGKITGHGVTWKLVLMCIHAVAHINAMIATNFALRRGCEHDELFQRELARLFPMTFTTYGAVPPFAASIMKFVP